MKTTVGHFALGGLLFSFTLGSGCGGGSASTANFSTAEVPVVRGSVQVNLDFSARSSETQAHLPTEAQDYTVDVVDSATDLQTVDTVEVSRTPGSNLPVNIAGVPVGQQRVVVVGRSAEGRLLGTFEQEIEVSKGTVSKVTVSSLFEPGPTREVGLISVSSNGQQADSDSRQPSISGDGRFVAFSSDATNLLTLSSISNARASIYVRDRATGTTTRVSVPPEGTTFRSTPGQPRISDDGRFILFGAGSLYLRDRGVPPVQVSLGGRLGGLALGSGAGFTGSLFGVLPSTRLVSPNFGRATLSGDGRWIAFSDVGVVSVQERATGTTTRLDISGVSPTLSSDGRYIAYIHFLPTTVIFKDRTLGTTTRFLEGEKVSEMALSGDGRWLAVRCESSDSDRLAGPLKLIEVQTGAITQVAASIDGSPSISRDGRYVAFRSALSNLVFNDANGVKDIFVWDRQTQAFARVNVAADGTAVEGAGDEIITAEGHVLGSPSLSANGNRIAFPTRDDLLVPDGFNRHVDIFSAVVPTAGFLYVSTGNKIVRLPNALFVSGNPDSAVTLFEAPLGTSTGQLYLDTANDRLFAVVGNSAVRVFNQASTRTGTDSSSLFKLPATGIAGDATRGKVYVSSTIAPSSTRISSLELNASGSLVAGNSFVCDSGSGNAMFLDSRLDELYLGTTLRSVSVFKPASRLSGRAVLFRTLIGPSTQLSEIRALDMDASPQGIGSIVNALNKSNLVVFSGSLGTGLLSLFNGNGSFVNSLGDVAPLRIIQGPATGLKTSFLPGLDSASQMATDRFTGTLYVGTPTSIRVFSRASTAQGNVAPDRTINLPTQGIALDRTR